MLDRINRMNKSEFEKLLGWTLKIYDVKVQPRNRTDCNAKMKFGGERFSLYVACAVSRMTTSSFVCDVIM